MNYTCIGSLEYWPALMDVAPSLNLFFLSLLYHMTAISRKIHTKKNGVACRQKKNQDGINTYHYVLYIKLFIYLYPECWGYCFRSMPPLKVGINVRNLYCLVSKIGFLMMQRTISLMLIRVMRRRA